MFSGKARGMGNTVLILQFPRTLNEKIWYKIFTNGGDTLDHYEKLLKAIELERKTEMENAIEEIKRTSAFEREKEGKAILDLKGKYVGMEVGGLHLVKFGRKKAIETDISVGDVVLISLKDPLKSDLYGTVVEKTKRSLTVALTDHPPRWVLKDKVRIDLFFNDVTFKRMEDAIRKIMKAKGRLSVLRDIMLGRVKPASPANYTPSHFFDENLNEYQKECVSLSLGSKDIFLIHGPPGTGKTRTLTEIIVQEVMRGNKVLATADSNTAADNILMNLIKYKGLKVVRIGHPARVEKELKQHTLSFLIENEPDYSTVRYLREEAQKLSEKRDSFLKPTPQFRRGLSDEEILRLSKRKGSVRGLSKAVISSMARWIEYNVKVQKFYEEAKNLEERIVKRILERSDVVVGTNSSVGMEYMENHVFDVVVIDEASQSTEPSCLIPIIHGKKIVMSGDHKQLPPTILNPQAEPILSKTLFERLIESYPSNSRLLRIQYRMNEKIMEFSSKFFYGGKLIADESVKSRTLRSLGIKNASSFEHPLKDILSPDEPLVLVDTSEIPERFERQRPGSTSRENALEANIVCTIVDGFLKMKVSPGEIGVITPYDDQVDLLKRMIKNEGIKVSSVDGFQGREKEIIILSLVRSNKRKDVGFLMDERRLNVSLTRAKSKLVIIGDFSTLSHDPLYRALLIHVKDNGKYILFNNAIFW